MWDEEKKEEGNKNARLVDGKLVVVVGRNSQVDREGNKVTHTHHIRQVNVERRCFKEGTTTTDKGYHFWQGKRRKSQSFTSSFFLYMCVSKLSDTFTNCQIRWVRCVSLRHCERKKERNSDSIWLNCFLLLSWLWRLAAKLLKKRESRIIQTDLLTLSQRRLPSLLVSLKSSLGKKERHPLP